VIGYNLANTNANTPLDEQHVILANALLINSRYRDVHGAEAADDLKETEYSHADANEKVNCQTPAEYIATNNDDGSQHSKIHSHDNIVTTTSSKISFSPSVGVAPERHHLVHNEHEDSKTAEDTMYLELHETAESIDQKLLKLLRDDLWTQNNDSPRPGGKYFDRRACTTPLEWPRLL
jgi:hypothetical protein